MAYKDMEKRSKAIKKHNVDNMAKYDRLNILVPKGEREKIKAVADSKGKSLNTYVTDLIYKDILHDRGIEE